MQQIVDFFTNLFDSSDWPPRWHCGKWTEFHGWLYIISDLMIWSAYFALPIVIIRYISRKKNIRFARLYFLFAAFILACGATHFLDAVIFWIPVYRLSALVRFITGAISWLTVFYVVKYLPVIFSLRSQSALEAEIEERKKTELALKKSRKDYELLVGGVKDYAIFMLDTEGRVASWNSGAESIKGYTAAEIIGQPIDVFYTSEQVRQNEPGRNLQYALLNGKYESEGWRVRKDGTLFWADVVFTTLFDEDNQFYGYAKVTRDITERKKTQDALNRLNEELEKRVTERTAEIEKTENRFRALLENNHDIISLNNDSLKLIYRSPSSSRITGWTDEEIDSIGETSHIHIDDREKVSSIVSAALNNPGKPQPYLFRYLHKNGHYIWLEGTVTKLLPGNNVNGLVFNSKEVTERVELERLLNKANVLARIGGWEINMIKRTVFWSDITREIHETGYDYMPDLQNGIKFYKEGPDRDLISQKVKEAIELGKPWDVELKIITAKNNERWIRSIGETEFADGKCIRVYGSFQDIDGRKKAEIERGRLNERLHLATQSAQLGLWDWDIKNNKLTWDEAMYRLYNLTENEFTAVYDGWTSRVHAEDRQRVDNDIQLALANKKDYNPEFRIVWPDTSVHYINASGIIERDIDGNAVRMTGFNWDVTERKNTEEKIKTLNIELEEKVISRTEQLRKTNEELEAFSYSVSHDLRAPLRAIIGFTSILEEDYSSKLNDEARRITSVIKNNTTKMGILIDDLLSFSRLGRQQIVKTKLRTAQLVQDIIADIGTKNSGRHINWIIEPLPDAAADPTTIRQVWINLLSNAIKYSYKQQQPIIEIGTAAGVNETIFYVKDNGVGFDEKYSDKLFKVFQRLHSAADFEGTGVGLAIVQRIISKHGGKVWAEGKPGEGACFYFSLPAMERN
ncbi:PAS domain-containing protein [Ferruginibacter paludis]|uniref:PAS domain-containing sensor histidine kinase n=1 Tax=Ferruginibacter paludis TaxID=1310417 RepID=UPI0025B37D5C|nr:PAS domain-containing protein [Ferruginibacter paludis]MDN3655312.1 PAS domain-containing protein [Ferruginibacter paludis]